jgi:hypothetical protein
LNHWTSLFEKKALALEEKKPAKPLAIRLAGEILYLRISMTTPEKASTPVFKSTRLLDQLREHIRYPHYSLRIEQA